MEETTNIKGRPLRAGLASKRRQATPAWRTQSTRGLPVALDQAEERFSIHANLPGRKKIELRAEPERIFSGAKRV